MKETEIRMKRMALILMVLGLTTAACGTTRANRRAAFTMQPITELAVGTLKLDGTAEAVTAQQASELLPMWEVYKQLVSSDTAAQAEIDGLSAQIRASMTEAQQQSITAMKLGERDVFALMQSGQGGTTGPAVRPNGSSNGQGTRPTGGNNFFVGGGPGGPEFGGFAPGGDFPGGGTNNQSTQGQSSRQSQPPGVTQPTRPQVPAPVLNALIEYLKKKAG